MNDRFKFRFYDEKNNFMITDEDSDENWNKCIELYDKDEWYFCVEKNLTFVLDYFDDKDFVVMQCTGLKDKNGKLIYEGDIVSIDDGELKGVAQRHDKFDEYYGCIEIKLICKHTTIYKPTVFVESEVIGNIYTDAHLLEETKND